MCTMRTLAATLFMSLDGVVESPEKWSFPFWSDETQKFKLNELPTMDALLLGRVTYEDSRPPGRAEKTPTDSQTDSTTCQNSSSRRR